MRQPVRVELGSVLKSSENVRLRAFEVSSDRKVDTLCRLLSQDKGRVLIFARTKRGADRLTLSLTREGFAAATIHGDRSQSQRTAALTSFQQGRVRVLVATDVAARGIHVDEISQVINYDLPEMAENFIHRVGRSGRAGAQGLATTLFGMDQRGELVAIERTLGIKIERMQASDLPERAGRKTPVHRTQSDAASRIGRMPGEFLQAQTV
jgi:ATP-dependent RNA helicase RhlE